MYDNAKEIFRGEDSIAQASCAWYPDPIGTLLRPTRCGLQLELHARKLSTRTNNALPLPAEVAK